MLYVISNRTFVVLAIALAMSFNSTSFAAARPAPQLTVHAGLSIPSAAAGHRSGGRFE